MVMMMMMGIIMITIITNTYFVLTMCQSWF